MVGQGRASRKGGVSPGRGRRQGGVGRVCEGSCEEEGRAGREGGRARQIVEKGVAEVPADNLLVSCCLGNRHLTN